MWFKFSLFQLRLSILCLHVIFNLEFEFNTGWYCIRYGTFMGHSVPILHCYIHFISNTSILVTIATIIHIGWWWMASKLKPNEIMNQYYLIFLLTLFFRCVKYNLPNIPDFETLFVQTQEFILSCNGEHVRYATDSCEYRVYCNILILFSTVMIFPGISEDMLFLRRKLTNKYRF